MKDNRGWALRPSFPEELPQQMALWRRIFGDTQEFLDYFYNTCCSPRDVVVLEEKGEVCSMAAILPMTVCFPDGRIASAGYIYAFCTRPEDRGRGMGGAILDYADRYLKEKGADGVILVPAEKSLYEYFGSHGYRKCFLKRIWEVARNEISQSGETGRAEKISPEDYGVLRERLLTGRFHVAYGLPLLSLQNWISEVSGGGLFRLNVSGTEGCAAVEKSRSDYAEIKELLLPPQALPRGLEAIAAAVPATRYQVRIPALEIEGDERPFGMMKWYREDLSGILNGGQSGYLGFGFD
ncbi:hypothetical protein SDC9_68585 [bioreactor metagenome]|uniref:N-acetyltransferase domain-containing protein n=1 Tax=bioreactor metagenome TaxID=1076179 RepID=A0A644Y7N2_9ZZZZ